MLISYAQNFEDIILWRALKNIKKGFYIDIGAWSPTKDSVTRCFYDAGWNGVNIEPNPHYFSELAKYRTRDINLKFAVSNHEGQAIMSFVRESGLSTLDQKLSDKYQADGWSLNQESVELRSLPAIWFDHVSEKQDVHFLKIDIEGLEEAVIKAHDWKRLRPWVVVVEATLPMSQIPAYRDWEPILLSNKYDLVYQDGLNRFYLAKEHDELKPAFQYPPNVFDNFLMASEAELIAKNKKLHNERKSMKADLRIVQSQSDELASQLSLANAQLNKLHVELENQRQENEIFKLHLRDKDDQILALHCSRSWRITSPLRWISTKINFQNRKNYRQYGRRALQKISFFIMRQPRLMALCRIGFNKFPGVKVFLHDLIIGRPLAVELVRKLQVATALKRGFTLNDLSYRGREIYHDLSQSIEAKGEF